MLTERDLEKLSERMRRGGAGGLSVADTYDLLHAAQEAVTLRAEVETLKGAALSPVDAGVGEPAEIVALKLASLGTVAERRDAIFAALRSSSEQHRGDGGEPPLNILKTEPSEATKAAIKAHDDNRRLAAATAHTIIVGAAADTPAPQLAQSDPRRWRNIDLDPDANNAEFNTTAPRPGGEERTYNGYTGGELLAMHDEDELMTVANAVPDLLRTIRDLQSALQFAQSEQAKAAEGWMRADSELLAERQASERAEWQPMSTAPRDGRVVLLSDGEGYVIRGFFDGKSFPGHWRTADRGIWSSENHFTHWLPDCYPSPPNAKAALTHKTEGENG